MSLHFNLDPPPHPLSGSTLSNWIRLLRAYPGLKGRRKRMAAVITLLVLAGIPIRAADRALGLSSPRRRPVQDSPIFIVGHWRSGTTYLHNLLSQDPQFCYLKLEDCIIPPGRLQRLILPRLIRPFIPSVRPMDRVPVELHLPQEEEWLLATRATLSFNHCFFFPQFAPLIFERLLDPETTHYQEWERLYLGLARQMADDFPNRQLILKNPGNAARIPFLRCIFPDAKFIHIIRNPYEVYPSTMYLWEKLLPWWSLQAYRDIDISRHVFDSYSLLMSRFRNDSHTLPLGSLAEVRYEDLEARPLETLAQVYERLGIAGYTAARPSIEDYLSQHSQYEKNRFALSDSLVSEIYSHWHSAIDDWGYEVPDFP